ncbi:unnamed protein product [Rotaria sp. Silwood2]|nr:unnamed protein product [Rotaria sp. Silwood2]
MLDKQHHKHKNITSNGVNDQGLYPDKEKVNKKKTKDINQSQSPALENHAKQDETIANRTNNSEEQSQSIENVTNDNKFQDNTIAVEQQQQSSDENKNRKSRSKKKEHHRYDNFQHNNNDNFQQESNFLGDLPPHLRVHQQPLYNSYNQVYEESILRGDLYQKQAKRSTRLPPEAKQKLLPHEDDKTKQYQLVGYFQQQLPDIQPPFNPYQTYTARPNFYGTTVPYNPRQVWSNIGGPNMGDEEKIDRLRNHISVLEHELHKLQKKLNKATLNYHETPKKPEINRIKRRSKRDTIGSPRQTPVIVELNTKINENIQETSSKKQRNRADSNHSLQKGQNPIQQTDEISVQNETLFDHLVRSQTPKTQDTDSYEGIHSNDNRISENEGKIALSTKSSREETAARLAHAAVAHVNARQQLPPPPLLKQQDSYQNDVLPKGQVQRLPVNGNINHSNDLYQQQRNVANLNYNQSNNNEVLNNNNNNNEAPHRHSVEKILDAFERVYLKDRKSATTPVKVKYIPEENFSHYCHQRNKNNNNQCRSASRNSQSSSSSSSSSSSTWANTSDETSSEDPKQNQVIIK